MLRDDQSSELAKELSELLELQIDSSLRPE